MLGHFLKNLNDVIITGDLNMAVESTSLKSMMQTYYLDNVVNSNGILVSSVATKAK